MVLEGKVWKYGRDVDTDAIIPARYLVTEEPSELGKHCLESLDPEFANRVAPGDILVAEENFGCGSSREHAALALKGAGISCVIAKSFARIFYRNAINSGLPILESLEAVDGIKAGQRVRVDTTTGEITNLDTGKVFCSSKFPQFIQDIIDSGGLISYVKKKIKSKR